jgi:hypothetical protein
VSCNFKGHDVMETNLSLTEFGVENNGMIHVEITKTMAEVRPKQIMMKICRVENNGVCLFVFLYLILYDKQYYSY